MKEYKNKATLDKALRQEIKAAAKAQLLTRLPYGVKVVLTYMLPAFLVMALTSFPLDADVKQILFLSAMNLFCEVVLLGPILLGVHYALVSIARGEQQGMALVFSPLGEMRTVLRGIRMSLCILVRTGLVMAAPTALYMGTSYAALAWMERNGITAAESVLTVVLLLSLAYMLLLLPLVGHIASYTMGYARLYDDPAIGVWRATKESSALLRGQRRGMLAFTLSFVPWIVGGIFTFGLLSVFGFAYMNISFYMLGDRLRADANTPPEN